MGKKIAIALLVLLSLGASFAGERKPDVGSVSKTSVQIK